ncbi:hypothetical protein C8A01DRAFT_32364 [Parachaetomium inaequale]|uniref:Uncharacterized protein n=1 Tax=Parachaetomium inaequale TaxID=2588326 RepID=A0AAN6PQJ2_9PEZI|nr:hypothetical protein C8A01DRAFT_32364 [Parachaetomium inaequale]
MRIPDGISSDGELTVLNAYQPTTSPWERAAASMQDKGEQPWRESLDLTPQERDPQRDASVSQYLLVGFTLPGLESEHFRMHPSQKKQMPVGTHLDPTSVTDTPDALLPIMVVVQMQEETEPEEATTLYALINPSHGLCTPHRLAQKAFFYLPMFRDSAGNLNTRGPAWNPLVRSICVNSPSAEAERSRLYTAKQKLSRQARRTSKVVLGRTRSLQGEVSLLLECFLESKQPWHLKELRTVLSEAEADLEHLPRPSYEALLDNEATDWDREDSEAMIREVYEQWPDLRSLKLMAEDVDLMKRQLVDEDIWVEFRLLRPFIARCKEKISGRVHKGKPDMSGICAKSLKSVKTLFGVCESTVPISKEDQNRLILAIKSTLEKILEASRKFGRDLKESVGDQLFEKMTSILIAQS